MKIKKLKRLKLKNDEQNKYVKRYIQLTCVSSVGDIDELIICTERLSYLPPETSTYS